MKEMGINALINIIINITCMVLSYWALQSVDWNKFFKKILPTQARIVTIFVAIALGYLVAGFFVNIFTQSNSLRYLFF